MSLESTTLNVIRNFISIGQSFTTLDVSNMVKTIYPYVKHHEIKNIVRSLYLSEIEPCNYTTTLIAVKLADGTDSHARLYHKIDDLYDLDNKYDAQKRAQNSSQVSPGWDANIAGPAAVTSVTSNDLVASTPSTPISINTGFSSSTPVSTNTGFSSSTPISINTGTVLSHRDLWSQLFKSQPSLFNK